MKDIQEDRFHRLQKQEQRRTIAKQKALKLLEDIETESIKSYKSTLKDLRTPK